MSERRNGRIKIEPGPWSLAVATRMSQLVEEQMGSRRAFTEEGGFSTRINQLLNGQRAWYLEDVEQACAALGLDMLDFLDKIDVTPTSDPVPSLKLVANEKQESTGNELDSDFDNA